MRVQGERARVLVTVKATPQPSEKYGDTSCVAGIRLDGGHPTWIRLYPIAFRWLDGASQFRKYDIIDLEVRRRDADTRRESYSPTQDSWTVVDHLPPWKARHEIVAAMEPTSTCGLIRAARTDVSATSLGLVYPRSLDGLVFEPHGSWSSEQITKMRSRMEREASALVPAHDVIPAPLKAPRYKVKYRYRCSDSACTGHVNRLLDWELTALQNRYRDDAELRRAVTTNFLDKMFATDRRSGFFMGNFELAARRSKFSILGVYSPRASDTIAAPPTLF